MFDAALSETPFPDDEPAAPRPERVRLLDLQRRPSVAKTPQPSGSGLRAAPGARPRQARAYRRDRGDPRRAAPAPQGGRRRLPACRVEGDVVRVRMTGACVGCQLASMTVLGVRMKLIEKLGFPVKVVPV